VIAATGLILEVNPVITLLLTKVDYSSLPSIVPLSLYVAFGEAKYHFERAFGKAKIHFESTCIIPRVASQRVIFR
jgi:hypothetical protein